MKMNLPALFLFSLILFSCQKEMGPKKHHCGAPCPKDRMCTMEYISLQIQIQDADGRPMALDSFYTVQLKNGKRVKFQSSAWEDSVAKSTGNYVYWSDAMGVNTKVSQQDVRFMGYKNGRDVVNKVITVGDDCCHVFAVDPNPIVVVVSHP